MIEYKGRSNNSGFTLAEVLMSISVLTVAFAALAGLILSALRANQANINNFLAYGLAEEGIEAFRNIRDSHWLSNFSWTGYSENVGLSFNPSSPFEHDTCSFQQENISFYRIFFNPDYKPVGENMNFNPWMLQCLDFDPRNFENLQASDLEKLSLYQHILFKGTEREIVQYLVGKTDADDTKSKFFRYIMVEFFPLEGKDNALARIQSIVQWNERGRTRKLSLEMFLTDWKGSLL
ncbi:prepilin-type N-terminal cleavage/methylation domain-containing protein [Candidatus Peregrinibacteria bacterium]|nr:prepilin-type N-terminal cleavage/methylation domain-containing protein [Candidatus Peregrinibacteria bacterium]